MIWIGIACVGLWAVCFTLAKRKPYTPLIGYATGTYARLNVLTLAEGKDRVLMREAGRELPPPSLPAR